MKNILYSLAALLLPAVLLTSCYEDKSSDRYDPAGTIHISGVETQYTFLYEDYLDIKPVVKSDNPNAKLEYAWMLNTSIGTNLVHGAVRADTIWREKDIRYLLDITPGTYHVGLKVTDTSIGSGYAQYVRCTLKVETPFTVGTYLLKETASGDTEMDFINPSGELLPNLLEAYGGAPLAGAPQRISLVPNYYYTSVESTEFLQSNIIVPTSKKDMRIMNLNDLSTIWDFKTVFYEEERAGIPDETPLLMTIPLTAGYYPQMATSKHVYLSRQNGSQGLKGSGKFGYPIEGQLITKERSFSRYAITGSSGYMQGYTVFDELNGEFQKSSYSGSAVTMLSNYTTKRRLLYMGVSNGPGVGWGVFEGYDTDDGEDWNDDGETDDENGTTLNRYIYQLNFSSGSSAIVSKFRIDPADAPNFCKADVYGTNKYGASGQVIYAGVGDKLYRFSTATRTETLLEPEDLGAGEQITMITQKGTGNSNGSNNLLIATFKGGNYKLYIYEIVQTTGVPTGKPTIITGVGKILDAQHTSAFMSYYMNL